ncbi:MAG: ParB/RepB/Spo0J family partition protein [Erysipelotrichaceae bacterium]|nr:ParB/RepB/Spo0J family partition protein [Erysipelotrichaceae bacterium]MCI9312876.1 ParB/RepB/Spo0J family partition protein [Erysipelotrichaceae bacterium]
MRESKIVTIDEIQPNPYQPRLEFNDDALMELAQSIRENGLIQPISVRACDSGYQIVAGERRYRAMKLNGMVEVPVLVMDADELQMAEMALVENIQRENLSAIEEAKSYIDIMKYANLNQSQLALKIGKSQSSIANKIRLLNLDDNIQNAVNAKLISERHARALLGADAQKQQDYLDKILKKGLSVSQTERMIKADQNEGEPKKRLLLKGVTRNMKIALNTIHQAVKMVEKTGVDIQMKEAESDDEVIVTLRFHK